MADSEQAVATAAAAAPTTAAVADEEISVNGSAAKIIPPPAGNGDADGGDASSKRKIDALYDGAQDQNKDQQQDLQDQPPRKKGVAAIKPEYLIHARGAVSERHDAPKDDRDRPVDARDRPADDRDRPADDRDKNNKSGKRQKQRGQNTNRDFGSSRDAIPMCAVRARENEFTATACPRGNDCKFTHDIRDYLARGKRADLSSFDGTCPVYEAVGRCSAGWRCRFAGSHSAEVARDDGRTELVLLTDEAKVARLSGVDAADDGVGVVNLVAAGDKIAMRKKQVATPRTDAYMDWLNRTGQGSGDGDRAQKSREFGGSKNNSGDSNGSQNGAGNGAAGAAEDAAKPGAESGRGDAHPKPEAAADTAKKDNQASFTDPPPLPSEKRRLYYGPETPVLAPLTTQGNLPFRRLAVDLGAQLTWSEMACAMPIISGEKGEWTLIKAHRSETVPPTVDAASAARDAGYDHARDLRYGVQISAAKPWLACKTTELLTRHAPQLRAVDLNCGCPIDLVFRQGAGSALMDSPGRLEKILRGMNTVSGEVPVTVKIRTGVRDGRATADRLVERLAFGGPEAEELGLGAAGVQAITLHGRSRQQRYTRSADWAYIAECKALIDGYNRRNAARSDTVREPDARHSGPGGSIYFCGNGDCYSHQDYFDHIAQARVDSVMIGRGALIKPWIFEEIATGQHLDKTASQRLEYVERFARYGLQTWGSDEMGVGTTRRFLLEWLSFACRYVPVGLLEHLPPNIQDRPPAFRGRSDLETLLSSDNYRDWIKISEMFLGPAHKDFRFEPKHRSNAYESVEAEG